MRPQIEKEAKELFEQLLNNENTMPWAVINERAKNNSMRLATHVIKQRIKMQIEILEKYFESNGDSKVNNGDDVWNKFEELKYKLSQLDNL